MDKQPEPISLTVHSVVTPSASSAADAERQRTRSGRLKMLAVLLVCAAPVVASYFTYYVIRPQGGNSYGTLIQPTRPLPALDLRDLDGKPVAAESLKRQWLLLTATPSACTPGCEPLLLAQRQLREMLGRERDRIDRVWLVLDDGPLPTTLVQGVTSTAGVKVLRASADQVRAWLEPAAGRALQDHLYVVDPMGVWMMRMPASAEPAKVKRDLERLLRASAFWDRAGR